jgi:hypothetical protein
MIIHPNTAFPNSTRRSIPHNVQEILIDQRFKAVQHCKACGMNVNSEIPYLKKGRASGLTLIDPKGKGVSIKMIHLLCMEYGVGDLLFSGSRVIVGMNLLNLMYFCNNLSSLATCHISELFVWFAMLYKNRRVRLWMSILPGVKPFISPNCCLRHLQP